VTDVRNFGFFVDVPDLAMSGLVPLSTMVDDFFVFDPERNHLVGRRSRRIVRLGDRVNVQVAKVDTFKKQVDFRLTRDGKKDHVRAQPPLKVRKQTQKHKHPEKGDRFENRNRTRLKR